MINSVERFHDLKYFIDGWFNTNQLPYVWQDKFQRIIKGASGIVRSIMRDESKIKIQYTHSNVAYCAHNPDTPDDITINIPLFYLTEKFYENIDYNTHDSLPYYMLATIDFVMAHESIHSLFTKWSVTQDELVKNQFVYPAKLDNKTELDRRHIIERYEKIIFIISNMYEDNAIHTVSIPKENGDCSYGVHIHNALDIVINKESFEIAKTCVVNQSNNIDKNGDWVDLPIDVKNTVELMNLINLIGFLRNGKFYDDPIWDCEFKTEYGNVVDLQKIRNTFINSLNVDDYNYAYLQQHAIDVKQIMDDLIPFDEFAKLSEFYNDFLRQLMDMIGLVGKSINAVPDSSLEEICNGIETYTGENKEDFPFEIDFNDLIEYVSNEIESKEKIKYPENWKAGKTDTKNVTLKDLTLKLGKSNIPNIDPRFAQFGRIMATIKTHMKSPKPINYATSGDTLSLNNLHKYSSTREIFQENAPTTSLEIDSEIVLVGDMSGSMSHDDLYLTMLEKLYSIGYSLKRSGSKFALYCHTTHGDTEIYYLGGNLIHKGEIEIGFSNALQIDKSGNNDADVIEWMYTNAFTGKKNRKFIFMLSDGRPCQSNKGSESGLDTEDYMRFIIDNGRKKGYNIFGMALVESVLATNLELYGDAYTIDASKNLEQVLKQTVMNIQKGKM